MTTALDVLALVLVSVFLLGLFVVAIILVWQSGFLLPVACILGAVLLLSWAGMRVEAWSSHQPWRQ